MFVTAASDNHFGEAIVSIYNIRKHFPDKQVYLYDLGLNETSVQQVKATTCQWRPFCWGTWSEKPDLLSRGWGGGLVSKFENFVKGMEYAKFSVTIAFR